MATEDLMAILTVIIGLLVYLHFAQESALRKAQRDLAMLTEAMLVMAKEAGWKVHTREIEQ
jgi:hypothetical protein